MIKHIVPWIHKAVKEILTLMRGKRSGCSLYTFSFGRAVLICGYLILPVWFGRTRNLRDSSQQRTEQGSQRFDYDLIW